MGLDFPKVFWILLCFYYVYLLCFYYVFPGFRHPEKSREVSGLHIFSAKDVRFAHPAVRWPCVGRASNARPTHVSTSHSQSNMPNGSAWRAGNVPEGMFQFSQFSLRTETYATLPIATPYCRSSEGLTHGHRALAVRWPCVGRALAVR